MNNSEDKTQEPVGGMKWIKANDIKKPEHNSLVVIKFKNGTLATALFQDKEKSHFNWIYDGRSADGEIDVWLDENYTSLPAPIKTEGEDETQPELSKSIQWFAKNGIRIDGAEKLIESAKEACMLIIGAYEGHSWNLELTAEKMFKYAKAGYAASHLQSNEINIQQLKAKGEDLETRLIQAMNQINELELELIRLMVINSKF